MDCPVTYFEPSNYVLNSGMETFFGGYISVFVFDMPKAL